MDVLIRWRFFLCVFVTSFLTVFPAYYFAIVNNAREVFTDFINSSYGGTYGLALTQQELTIIYAFTVTSFNIGSIFGSLSTAFFAERFGRRISMMVINNVIVIASAILMAAAQAANSYIMLVIGRIVAGYCAGLAYSLLAIYLTELSPENYRGFSASTQNLMISGNTLFTLALTLPIALGTAERWVYLQGLAAPLALLQILLTPLFPETPKYLLLKKEDLEGAKKAFLFVSPRATPNEIDSAFNHFRKEQEMGGKEISLLKAIRTRHIRVPIIISVVVNVATITTGIVVIFNYSTSLFEKIGYSASFAQYSSLIMSGCNTFGSIGAIVFMDRVGRRPLLLLGLITTTVCNLIFMIFSLVQDNTGATWAAYISLIAIMIHVTVFNIGPGAICFFISSEMTPQAARSLGATVSITVAGISQVVTNFAFPPVQDIIGAHVFLTLIIPTVVFTVYLYFTLPETKNRPVDEIIKRWRYDEIEGENEKESESRF